ncbi:hypothetical protein ACFX11_020217 [Malus domestica]
MEVVDFPGTMAKRKQAVHISMVVVGYFEGASTGVQEGFREVANLKLNAVDAGLLLRVRFGWRSPLSEP